MANKDTAKQWFESRDKPTQAQFAQVFDWLIWKDEGVAIGDIAGLVEALQLKLDQSTFTAFVSGNLVSFSGDGSYQIPAGYLLEKIIVLPSVAADIAIGSAPGNTDILPALSMSADGEVIVLNLFTKNGRTIYFTGLPAGTKIIFFSRIVKMA